MPVDCLELTLRLEMLGQPKWVRMTTQSTTAQERSHGSLEPGKMAQAAAQKNRCKGRAKSAPEIPMVGEEAEPEGTAPEPSGEDIAAFGDFSCLDGKLREVAPGRRSVEPSSRAPLLRD